MKLFKRIRNKIFNLWFRFKYRNMSFTPQGELFIKYLIDYYINFSTDIPIERFENLINKYKEKNKIAPALFKHLNDIGEDMEKALHFDTVFKILVGLLMVSKDRVKWIEYINDEDARKKMLLIIK